MPTRITESDADLNARKEKLEQMAQRAAAAMMEIAKIGVTPVIARPYEDARQSERREQYSM